MGHHQRRKNVFLFPVVFILVVVVCLCLCLLQSSSSSSFGKKWFHASLDFCIHYCCYTATRRIFSHYYSIICIIIIIRIIIIIKSFVRLKRTTKEDKTNF